MGELVKEINKIGNNGMPQQKKTMNKLFTNVKK